LFLILGASGYVGKRLFSTLGSTEAVGTHNSNSVDGSVYFDATCMSLGDIFPDMSQFSHCFIVFAEADIDACKADLDRSLSINVTAMKKIIDELINREIKPIFFSSEYVFDGEKGDYSESDSTTPNTVYGSQKREIEQYLEDNCDDYAVLRLAKVYGTDPADHTILSGWARQIAKGDRIRCARDQVFSAIHLDDVVAASVATARLDLSGIFNIAGPNPYSRLKMLQALLSQMKTGADVVECGLSELTFLDNRPMDLSMRPDRIQLATGLKFRTVDDCCREFVGNLEKEEAAARG